MVWKVRHDQQPLTRQDDLSKLKIYKRSRMVLGSVIEEENVEKINDGTYCFTTVSKKSYSRDNNEERIL